MTGVRSLWLLPALLPLLAASPGRAACADPQDLLEFERAAHRQLACELADRLLGEEGCQRGRVPECGRSALEQLGELVPGGFGDRLLASRGYSGARCRLALARAAELTLHALLNPPEPAAPPPQGSEPGEAPEPSAAQPGEAPEPSAAQPGEAPDPSAVEQSLSELAEVCDGVEVGLRSVVGGACAMLSQWGDILDGPRLSGCLTQALGRIADEVQPGASQRPGAPGQLRGGPGHGGAPAGHGRPGGAEQGGRP